MENYVIIERDSRRIFSRIGLGLFLLIFIQQVVSSVLYTAVAQAAPGLISAGWFNWVVSYVPLYLVGFPVFLLVIKNLPQSGAGVLRPRRMTGLAFIRVYLVAVACFYAFNLITVYASYLVEQARGSGLAGPADVMTQSDPWVNLFVVCMVAPIMEELIFRQLLYKRLIAFGGRVYILFSALLFALLHPNVYQLVYAFLIGLLLAGVRYFTGRLWLCVALHMAINFSGGGGALLVYHYFGEMASAVWSYVLLAFTVAGIAIAAHWLIKRHTDFVPDAGEQPSPGGRAILLNPGMLLYMVFVAIITVVTLFI